MGIVEALETTTKDAIDSGEHLVESTKKYYELKIFKQFALASSTLLKLLLVGSLALLGLVFSTIALAIFLGDYFASMVTGFLLTASIIFAIAAFMFLLRKKLEQGVIRKLSETFFEEI